MDKEISSPYSTNIIAEVKRAHPNKKAPSETTKPRVRRKQWLYLLILIIIYFQF